MKLSVVLVVLILAAPAWAQSGNYAVNAFALDPIAPNTIYVGTSLGVQKSTDAGATWQMSSTEAVSATAIAVNPRNPLMVYAGNLSRGMFRSMDGGISWIQLPHPADLTIQIDGTVPSTIYSANVRGIHKTIDSGNSWRELLPAGRFTSVAAAASEVYGISELGALFKSSDAGTTWRVVGAIGNFTNANSVVIDPRNPATLYVGGTQGVWKSSDGASTFVPLGSTDTRALALDPRDPNTVYSATTQGLLRSKNGGTTWSNLFPGEPVRKLAVHPSDSALLYAVTDSLRLIRSTNAGASWEYVSTDLLPQLPSAAVVPISAADAIDTALQVPVPISPAEGAVFNNFPRRTTVRWNPSPGAIRYYVQYDLQYNGVWQADRLTGPATGYVVEGTEFTFDFLGAQPGRWRVYPVSASGRGKPSEWRTFRYTR